MEQSEENTIVSLLEEIDKIQKEKIAMDFDKKYIQHFQLYSAMRDTLVRIKSDEVRIFLIQRAFCELVQAILVSRDNQMKRRLEGIIFESQDFFDIIKDFLLDPSRNHQIFNKQFELIMESIYLPPMKFERVEMDELGRVQSFQEFYGLVRKLINSLDSIQ